MREGHRVEARPSTAAIRARALANLERLPARYQVLRDAPFYPVEKSAALMRLLEEVRERYLGVPENPEPRAGH
jgi:hypothetical protein